MRAQRDNTNTEFDELLLARAAATITITKISRSYHFLSTSCSITDKYFCQLLAESHSAVSLSVVLKCRHFFPYSDCMCLFPDYLSWPLSCPLYVVCFDYNLTLSTVTNLNFFYLRVLQYALAYYFIDLHVGVHVYTCRSTCIHRKVNLHSSSCCSVFKASGFKWEVPGSIPVRGEIFEVGHTKDFKNGSFYLPASI